MPLHLFALRPLIAAGALACGLIAPTWAQTPPPAPSHPVTETLHGVTLVDPYRNLETRTPETLAWMRAQAAYAAKTLDAIPLRQPLLQRIEQLAQTTGDAVGEVLRMPGERYYYLRRKAGENQFKLVTRSGLAGAEQVLVDPEALARAAGGTPHAINYFMPSWDGRYVAYGISVGGSENATLYVLDTTTGRTVGEPIPRVVEEGVSWMPDNQRFAYNQLRALPPGTPDTETYLDSTVFLQTVGQKASQARPLFGPTVNRALKLDRLDVGQVIFSPDSGYMVARTTDTTSPEGKLFAAPLAALSAPTIDWQRIAGPEDKITDVALRGSELVARTYQGAPRGKLLAIPLDNQALAQTRTLVPEPATGVLEGFELEKDAVLTEERSSFTLRAVRYDAQGRHDIAPSVPGSTLITGNPAHLGGDTLVGTSSWTAPPRLLLVDAKGGTRDTGLRQQQAPAGVPEIVAEEVMVPSHDGVMVPLAILHRKDLKKDGQAPTLLIGYGAYGISEDAHYVPRDFAWFERGGVIAIANVRGGGAFGDPWHRAGFKATKPNTWKDGIAAAKYLIAQGYTNPKHLGIWGTSAGGIFVGRAVTEAPELFAAAIFDVGSLDTVRSENSANGVTNISEFGTVQDPEDFKALLAMSTYQHIEKGVAYPAVLLIHGMNDPRVDTWESAKTAAKLQVSTSSGKPVLLRLDEQAGHGIGSTAQQAYTKQADLMAFLLWQFGLAGTQP